LPNRNSLERILRRGILSVSAPFYHLAQNISGGDKGAICRTGEASKPGAQLGRTQENTLELSMTRDNRSWILIAIFITFTVLISGAGYAFYRSQEGHIKRRSFEQLAVVADLKVHEITTCAMSARRTPDPFLP